MFSIISKGNDNIIFCGSGDLNIGLKYPHGVRTRRPKASDIEVVLMINSQSMGEFPLDVAREIINALRLMIIGCFKANTNVGGKRIIKEKDYLFNLHDGSSDDIWFEVDEDDGNNLCNSFEVTVKSSNNLNGKGRDDFELEVSRKIWNIDREDEITEEASEFFDDRQRELFSDTNQLREEVPEKKISSRTELFNKYSNQLSGEAPEKVLFSGTDLFNRYYNTQSRED